MKIAHVTYGLTLGGIETMLVNIANEQVKKGHIVHIIVINNLINESLFQLLDGNIHFHCLHRRVGSKNPVPYIKLNFMLMKFNPDIIHLHYSDIAKYLFIPSIRKKTCVTQHDVCTKRNSRYLYLSKRIYAISNIVKEDIFKWTGLHSEVVLNGIMPELISHKSQFINNGFHIVQVSRLMHQKKGQHILIKAADLLVKRGYTDFSVSFIGDGESREYLQTLVDELHLNQYIHFLGAKDQTYIFRHLCEYDLFVQPSIWEGFGLTVAEAMAAKIPVLVSDNQGPLEIIDYGKYGYSFKSQDSADCADKIQLFLDKKNDSFQIEKAYNRVLELYNVKNTADTYLKKYRKLIESNYAESH